MFDAEHFKATVICMSRDSLYKAEDDLEAILDGQEHDPDPVKLSVCRLKLAMVHTEIKSRHLRRKSNNATRPSFAASGVNV